MCIKEGKHYKNEWDQVRSQKTYHFYAEDFSFTMLSDLPLSHRRYPKKGNVERPFGTVHRHHDSDFPPKSELRKRKVKEQSQTADQSEFFSPKHRRGESLHHDRDHRDTRSIRWSSGPTGNIIINQSSPAIKKSSHGRGSDCESFSL